MTAAHAKWQNFAKPGLPRPIKSSDLQIKHRYLVASGEAREIIGFDGGWVTYVVGHQGVFPIWDHRKWHSRSRPQFASEVVGEV